MEMFLETVSICIGIAGVIYACIVERQKAKLEDLIRENLQGMAGNICKIIESSEFAWNNFRYVFDIINAQAPESTDKSKSLKYLQLGHGDITAAHRMMINLLNQVLVTQSGLFGKQIINHPQKNVRCLFDDKDVEKSESDGKLDK